MRDSRRDIDVKNSLSDSVGEGEGGMIWENGIEICIISYVKQITSPSLMPKTGRSKPVHWNNPEGWDVEGGGSGDSGRGGHMYTDVSVADSCQYMTKTIHVSIWQNYCKVISLQLKEIN